MKYIIWSFLATIIIIAGVLFLKSKLQHTDNTRTKQTAVTVAPKVGGDKDSNGCIGSAGYSWCAAKNKCLRQWEEKCADSGSEDELMIKKALYAKNKWGPEMELVITVKDNDGTYANGLINAKEGGGGYYYAKKVGEEWKIVADGNGMINCESLKGYPDYPKEKIPSCYVPATGEVVKR